MDGGREEKEGWREERKKRRKISESKRERYTKHRTPNGSRYYITASPSVHRLHRVLTLSHNPKVVAIFQK